MFNIDSSYKFQVEIPHTKVLLLIKNQIHYCIIHKPVCPLVQTYQTCSHKASSLYLIVV